MTDFEPLQPTPRVLYVHDDISEGVRQAYGVDSDAFRLSEELFELLRRSVTRTTVLTLEEQADQLIARGGHVPFHITVGIGRAGERVAEYLHGKTGWFPVRRRVDVTREEDGRGGYAVVSLSAVPLAEQLRGIESTGTLAVVDDTVFSGLTMRAVLGALPGDVLASTHAFCLRCVAESLDGVRELCPISAGFAAEGEIERDVSFINASGLVMRVGIRRAGKPPMAFFERRSWMRAWFGGDAETVVSLSRTLSGLLDPDRVLG